MKCPHCTTGIHDRWDQQRMESQQEYLPWFYRSAVCPECKKLILEVCGRVISTAQGTLPVAWELLYPRKASRGPVPSAVPHAITVDYVEACEVLNISPKASAALSRRCLQNILRSHGYKAKQLWQEIDLVLAETDTTKALPTNLRLTIDGIRHFGNFSAHPTEDVSTLEIIEVEEGEAEWCLQILEDMFEHFYVRPADARARKAALDAKLKAAGKQHSK
jgi:hypothetical protein